MSFSGPCLHDPYSLRRSDSFDPVRRDFTMHSTLSYHDVTIRSGEAGCDPSPAMLRQKSHSCDCIDQLDTSQMPLPNSKSSISRGGEKQVLSPLVIKGSTTIVRAPSSASGPFSTPHLERFAFSLPARQKHPVVREGGAILAFGSLAPTSKTTSSYHGHLLGSSGGPAMPAQVRSVYCTYLILCV